MKEDDSKINLQDGIKSTIIATNSSKIESVHLILYL